jgi:hypothetical protein
MKSFFTLLLLIFCSCNRQEDEKQIRTYMKDTTAPDLCCAKGHLGALSCKLMPEELRKRKETVLSSLKSKVLEKKNLKDGYAFRFEGKDEVLDELNEFIKTERNCCDFFVFGVSTNGKKTETWLNITGPEGAKEFIDGELGL